MGNFEGRLLNLFLPTFFVRVHLRVLIPHRIRHKLPRKLCLLVYQIQDTQEVLPQMKARKYGRIAHIASIAGKEGNPGMHAYNTSKAGMIGFIKGVGKEVATEGITINAFAPAVIRTPFNAGTSDETLKYMLGRIPMGRVGEPEEAAEMLAFMVSKACSFTTGFTFDASGGRATY